MENIKDEQLLKKLAELGFQGAGLERDLKVLLAMNLTEFMLLHKIAFGEESVRYKLHLKKEEYSGAFALENYEATLQRAIDVEHQTINGVNTADLDERMKAINWIKAGQTDEAVYGILSDLKTIATTQEGNEIRDALRVKYWAGTPFEQPYLSELRQAKGRFEYTQIFDPSTYGVLHATLAYHRLCGNVDRLYQLTKPAGLNDEDAFHKGLQKDGLSFVYTIIKDYPEGKVEYRVPVFSKKDKIQITEYHVHFIPYQEIPQGIFNGVDTRELEGRMAGIRWREDDTFVQDEGKTLFINPVLEIIEDIRTLAASDEGLLAANLLQIKYWHGVPVYMNHVSHAAIETYDALPRKYATLPLTVHAEAAYNLFQERAVAKAKEHIDSPLEWIKLDWEKTNGYGDFLILPAGTYSEQQLTADLQMLPIANSVQDRLYHLMPALMRGALQEVRLINGNTVYLEASPEHHTINVYNVAMIPIPVNIQCSLDWSDTHIHLMQLKRNLDKTALKKKL